MEAEWGSESTSSLNSVGSGRLHPKPPSAPKPPTRISKPRRASFIRSPYLATMVVPSPRTHPRDRWITSVKRVSAQSPHKSSLSQAVVQAYSQSRKRTQSHPGPLLEDSATLDLRDEITQLRQQLRTAKKEYEEERAEVRRTKELLSKREKEVGELLAGGHISRREMTRLVGGRDNSTMISAQKHTIHRLQLALRNKEDELRSLQRDLKSTRLKELEVEKETYYKEIVRLQDLIEKMAKELNEEMPESKKTLKLKLNALNEAVIVKSRRLEELEEENEKLKKKQGKRGSIHGETGSRGTVADNYLDLSQSELISVVVGKEMKLKESSDNIESLSLELEQTRANHDTEINRLHDELARAEEETEKMKKKDNEREKSLEKLECVVKKLKEDRTHYRSLTEKNEQLLQEAQMTLSEREKEIQSLRNTLKQHQQTIEKEQISKTGTSFGGEREGGDGRRNGSLNELKAALILQREWRRMSATRRQKRFEVHLELTARQLQSVLRGHLVRKTVTDKEEENEEVEERVTEELQSILRGHMTRRRCSHRPLQELLNR